MAVLSILSDYRGRAGISGLIAGAIGLYVFHFLTLVVYRLYFHPLAKIPGPRLSAATWLREAYYGIWLYGQYPQQYLKDHQKYEVHISDPEFHHKVYHIGTKFNRPQLYYGVFNAHSMLSVEKNQDHRFLRSQFEPFFARKHILSMMSQTVAALVSKMTTRIEAEFIKPSATRDDGKPEPLILTECIRALATDCIFKTIVDNPEWESLLDMVVFQADPQVAEDEVARIVNTPKAEFEKRRKERNNAVVGDEVLAPENLAKTNLPLSYFADEMWIMLVADGETTTGALIHAAFHTLHNPEVHRKLFQELKTAFPEKPAEMPYLQLEALPYLTAIIKEALRLCDAATARFPRIVPEPGLQYNEYFLPAGTIVGLSGYTQHRDERIFPDAERFIPERYLGAEGKKLEKYMVAFSAGSTGCIGKNLAYGILYVALAQMFRRFEMELWDCGPEDVMIDCIYMAGFHSMKQRKIKVFVKEREE